MAEVKIVFGYGPGCVGVEDGDVGVSADGKGSLLADESGETSGCCGHPFGRFAERRRSCCVRVDASRST